MIHENASTVTNALHRCDCFTWKFWRHWYLQNCYL